MKNAIVIPCYNEAERLQTEIFVSFANSHPDFLLCFVNDGSKDKTQDIIDKMCRKSPNIIGLDLENNVGKAEGVRLGVQHMLQFSTISSIGFIDADLSTGFDDYKRLVHSLKKENKSVVIGSRKLVTDNIERNPLRLILSSVIGYIVHFILGLPIQDTQCGAKVFDRNSAAVSFNNPFLTRWLFDVEIFLRLKMYYGKLTLINKIKELALDKWEDVDGSKLGLKDSLMIPVQLFKIAYNYSFKYKFTGISTRGKSIGIGQARVA